MIFINIVFMQRLIKIHNQKSSKTKHIYNEEAKSILGRNILTVTSRVTNNVFGTMFVTKHYEKLMLM